MVQPTFQKGTKPTIQYIARRAAIRKLQISVGQFRTLCILKGIFPREPKKKPNGDSTKSYYFVKDIKFLATDPMIQVLRKQHAINVKTKKFVARRDFVTVQSLESQIPEFNLKPILRERYPTFVDALRDLDDALSMMYIFEHYPMTDHKYLEVTSGVTRKLREWEAYLVTAHAITKTFVSIKGFYYQAEVMGQEINWLVPHRFVPETNAREVDMSVMHTFLTFYDTLMSFVLYKLYNSLQLHYPPALSSKHEEGNGQLDQLLKQLQAPTESKPTKINKTAHKKQISRMSTVDTQALLSLDQNEKVEEEPAQIINAAFEGDQGKEVDDTTKLIFSGKKFFLGREVPRASLELLIRCFGGQVSWDGVDAPYPETDDDITHMIVDMHTKKHVYLARTYVQPQWVYDCVNNQFLIPEHEYAIGATLPPHLSPFPDPELEDYIPDRQKYLERVKDAIVNGVALEDDDEEEEEDESEDEKDTEKTQPSKRKASDDIESQHAAEIQAELSGQTFDQETAQKQKAQMVKKKRKTQREEEQKEKEEQERAQLITLTNKGKKTIATQKKIQEAKKEKLDTIVAKKKSIKKAAKASK